jgi:hypothetical protein
MHTSNDHSNSSLCEELANHASTSHSNGQKFNLTSLVNESKYKKKYEQLLMALIKCNIDATGFEKLLNRVTANIDSPDATALVSHDALKVADLMLAAQLLYSIEYVIPRYISDDQKSDDQKYWAEINYLSWAEKSYLTLLEYLLQYNQPNVFVSYKHKTIPSIKFRVGDLDSLRNTIWIYAALSQDIELVQLLLANGAKINFQDSNDKTALIYATASGNIELVQLLLTNGADVTLQDDNNETALIIAKKNHHEDIVNLLTSFSTETTDDANNKSSIQAAYATNDHITPANMSAIRLGRLVSGFVAGLIFGLLIAGLICGWPLAISCCTPWFLWVGLAACVSDASIKYYCYYQKTKLNTASSAIDASSANSSLTHKKAYGICAGVLTLINITAPFTIPINAIVLLLALATCATVICLLNWKYYQETTAPSNLAPPNTYSSHMIDSQTTASIPQHCKTINPDF